jgi:hypothetical protein
MSRISEDDVQFERKLRLKRKLTWGIIYLAGGAATSIATGAASIYLYQDTGRLSMKLLVFCAGGIALIFKGVLTLVKGEQPDPEEDLVNRFL